MFFLFPVGVDYRTDRFPIVTFVIMGFCVILYLIGMFLFVDQIGQTDILSDPLIDRFGLVPNKATMLTWFSHMFLHAGFLHLLGNMVYLFLFGAVVEDRFGRVKFLLFFLVGGLIAAAVHIIFSSPASAGIPMVGASGAISSCLGAFVILHPQTHVQFRYFFWLIFPFLNGEFTLPSWLVISLWFLNDLIGFGMETMAPNSGGGIAFAAHIGGTISGLIIATGFRMLRSSGGKGSRKEKQSDKREIFLHHDGEKMGPFSMTEVGYMRETGVIGTETHFWEDGMSCWEPIGRLK